MEVMIMVVQHNLTAMNSNRMLGLTTSAQAKSTEKLSSGYKINRAADDAAGLAISEKMRKQIRGLTQASANAQDGISAVQTAEGALNEVQDMLQRMNELAVKSANGTNSTSDRDAIQAEIDQLITEIDRVSETTKFNETYLLRGDTDGEKDINFQYKEADVLSQDLYYIDGTTIKTLEKGTFIDAVDSTKLYYSDSTAAVGGIAYANSDSATYLESAGIINKDGYYIKKDGEFFAVRKSDKYDANETYYSSKAGTGAVESQMVKVEAASVSSTTAYFLKSDAIAYDSDGNKVDHNTAITSSTLSKYYSTLANMYMKDSEVEYSNYKTKGRVQFVDKDGNEIAANGLSKYIDNKGKLDTSAGLYLKTGGGIADYRAAKQTDVDSLVDSSTSFDVGTLTLNLHVGADATSNNQIKMEIESMSAETLGVTSLKVNGEDDTNALNAIETIKAALNKVSNQRADLGAIQNRLEHTINNLDNVVENTTSAESQIRDTDMATEMVKYANNNILAQAGQSMLAQANQSNQGVLSLLG